MKLNLIGGAFLNFFYNEFIGHVPVHAIRKGYLRLFNKRISKSAVILMHTRFLNFWKIEIGERVVINQNCLLDCRRYKITIGNDADIGPFTRIWTLGHNPDSSAHELYGGDTIIEDHVWIASGVTILPAVHIKRGAVVAAASVVHKSVDEKQIVAGNPARFIRLRSNDLTYKLGYKPLLD